MFTNKKSVGIIIFFLSGLLILFLVNLKYDGVDRGTQKISKSSYLATISISTDPQNLWDEEIGIYIKGKIAEPEYPFYGANYWKDWEIPIYFEFFEPGGNMGFSIEAGAKIFGGTTRTLPQKSLAITASKKYGRSRIDYRLFMDKSINQFKSIILRNGGQDFHKTHFLDGMVATLLTDTGLDVQAYRPVVVYLNGEYWGIHDMREKIDKYYLMSNHDLKRDDIDLLESKNIVKEGDRDHYKALIDFISHHDMVQDENYEYVKTQMDIENFIDYEVAEIYIANTDWPKHNIRYWRPRTEEGKWRWIVYDVDASFNDYTHNTIEYALSPEKTGNNNPYSTFLLRNLMKNENFKNLFIKRFAYHLDNTFEPEHVNKIIETIKSEMEPEMEKHFKKWGGSMGDWNNSIQRLKDFANNRPGQIRMQLQKQFNLSDREMWIFNSR